MLEWYVLQHDKNFTEDFFQECYIKIKPIKVVPNAHAENFQQWNFVRGATGHQQFEIKS